MSAAFDRFIGVDFSGAPDAGRRIWIAVGHADNGRLTITDILPAADLPGSGVDRADALAALRRFASAQSGAIIGLDFPFSLPADLLDGDNWPSFAETFRRRWPDPDAFREGCRARTGNRELKRLCDREARTPFAAYNLRLYRQTYYGIADLLAPLARDGGVCIVPLVCPPQAAVTLVEACPASLLKRLETYPSYKGRSSGHAASRVRIVEKLAEQSVVLRREIADTAIAQSGGDALDAIVATLCAWRASTDPVFPKPHDRREVVEGRVYF